MTKYNELFRILRKDAEKNYQLFSTMVNGLLDGGQLQGLIGIAQGANEKLSVLIPSFGVV